MNKKEHTIVEHEEFVGEAVSDMVIAIFKDYVDQHSFHTMRDYAPYGDTEVEVCQYISDEEEEEFRENVEKEMTVDSIINELSKDAHFRDAIKDMIKHVVWHKELEV